MMSGKKILILSASIGMGHLRAAKALEQAFNKMPAGSISRLRHEDTLKYANHAFREIYSRSYADLADKAPELLGLIYERSDQPNDEERIAMAFQRLNTQPLIRLVEKFSPDVVVCTHSLPAYIISGLICKKSIKAQHAVVVTDFDIHSAWLCNHYSRYFVALDETREHLQQLGFDKDRIGVTGIPIDPVFRKVLDKAEMQAKHGLDCDRFTILLSAGGFGMLPMESILDSLSHLNRPFQVVAVCGRNYDLKERIDHLYSDGRLGQHGVVFSVGYTTQMEEYMSAADLMLGKPGGLTVSEALAKGLVFAIVHPIPGQEQRNSDHLLEQGAAIRCNNLLTLGYKIGRLINDEQRWRAMQRNAFALARPYAAEQIASEVMELAAKTSACAIHPTSHRCSAVRAPSWK